MSDAKRALLQKYLRGGLGSASRESWVIERRPDDAPALPSLGQEQLWLHAQLVDDLILYNEPVTVRRTGPLDFAVLKQSLNEIIRRHQGWRTNFAIQDGQLVQVINPAFDLAVPLVDLTKLSATQRETEALRLATEDARRPFDLNQGPLVRALLVRLSDNEHRLYLTLHQIIFDGVSLYSVFMPELTALYDAFLNGRPSPLNEPPIQYADFAHWQRQPAQSELCTKQMVYWRNQLAGAPAALELPTDRPRPTIQTFRGEQLSFTFPQQLSDALKTISRREGATLFMTLLAAFQIVLHRYTDQDDLLVGTVTTSRKRSELDGLLGFFLNTLVLRTQLSGDPTFSELLGRVRKVTVDALGNADLPVHRLLKELDYERDPSRNPLFQVMFVLEPPLPNPQAGWELSQVDVDAGIARVDLYLELDDRPEGLVGRFRYNSDLFEAASIHGMLDHLRMLLDGIAANPERPISEYALRTDGKISRDSVRPQNPFSPFLRSEIEQAIGDRFESQVRKSPDQIAIRSARHEWSYEDLNQRANRIAQAILGVRQEGEERIALLFDHDAPMIAAMLGSLKAGKTYVPLDPSYPRERLAFILDDSQATTLVTNNANLELAQQLVGEAVRLINVDRLPADDSRTALPTVSADRLAYILYTSGSTGNPKGVMQNHRNVLHYIRVYTNNLHLNSDDRLTLLSSYCFDASVMDIYGALLNGATLCPIDVKREGLDGLLRRLTDERITVYQVTQTSVCDSTASVAQTLVCDSDASVAQTLVCDSDASNHRLKSVPLRLVVLGGEKVTRADVESYKKYFADDCLFVNGLGPTEATVALQNFIDKQTGIAGNNVPVGFPVEDTEVLLLNKQGKPAEVSGEIAIKSAHVAVGYWRNPVATATAFSTNGKGPDIRIYRTGDMGRRLPDGSLQFEGRKDFQVKIRGFRIELGEIESALTQHPSVREGVVIARERADGDKRLVAYVVSDQGTAVENELRDYLRQKLPEYMVPGCFVVMDALPQTASGKLNRRALPVPDERSERSAMTVIAARNPLEKSLTEIWSEVLNVNSISINDNFFELGGHSLLAVRLFAQVEKKLGKRLPLTALFQAPTVADLAAILQRDRAASWSSLVPIQPLGSKTPFFCVHAVGGTVLEYHDLARQLGPDQPFYALQSRGLDENQEPHKRIEDMAAHYIREIREVQPRGPYLIGGRSLGGVIAYEIACQLRASGEEIALLAVLDSYPVGYKKLATETGRVMGRLGTSFVRFGAHLSNLRRLSLHEKLLYVINKSQYGPVKLRSQIWRTIYSSYHRFGRELPRAMRDVQEFNWLAAHAYVPERYQGKVTLFWASSDLRASFDLVEGWQALAKGGLEVLEIPGTHLDIIKDPHVTALAAKLEACLERAEGRGIIEAARPEPIRQINPPALSPRVNESQAA